jgi:hypothetical protein
MKKYIIILLLINSICDAQKLSVQPYFGSYSFYFVGNGSCQQTSIIKQSYFHFNNPYINKVNLGKSFGLDFEYKLSAKNKISLMGEMHRVPYKIEVNRTYSLGGYYKQTNGFLKLNYTNPQIYYKFARRNSTIWKSKFSFRTKYC